MADAIRDYPDVTTQDIGLTQRGNTDMAEPTREEIDAKIAASESRTETKLARLEGKLDLVLSKLDGGRDDATAKFDSLKDDNRSIRSNQWVVGFGLAVLIVAIVALFPVFFGIGIQVKDIVDHEIEIQFNQVKK
jgi:hypothetical protein